MKIRVDRRTLSIKFIFAISLIYMLDLITIGRLSEVFLLDISNVTNLSEYWRFITYPLAYGSFSSIALFLMTFILFVPLLEKINSKVALSLMAFTAVGIQSSILLLMSNFTVINPISRMAGLSWFMLGLTIFTYPGSELGIMGKRIKSWVLVVFMGLLFSGSNLSYFWAGWTSYPLSQHIMMASGILLGFGASFILRYITHKFFNIFHEEHSDTMYNDFSPALVESEEEVVNNNSHHQSKNIPFSVDFEDSEITLNSILDKINEYGKESLTPDELRFLKNYKS